MATPLNPLEVWSKDLIDKFFESAMQEMLRASMKERSIPGKQEVLETLEDLVATGEMLKMEGSSEYAAFNSVLMRAKELLELFKPRDFTKPRKLHTFGGPLGPSQYLTPVDSGGETPRKVGIKYPIPGFDKRVR